MCGVLLTKHSHGFLCCVFHPKEEAMKHGTRFHETQLSYGTSAHRALKYQKLRDSAQNA